MIPGDKKKIFTQEGLEHGPFSDAEIKVSVVEMIDEWFTKYR